MHADQTHGINELRVFYLKNRKKINIYADKFTSDYLKKNFQYCFKNTFGYPATLKINKLNKFHKIKIHNYILNIESFSVKHGNINSTLYKINNSCAYASDVSEIFKKDLKKLKNLKYFIVDCLRYKYHPTHFNLDDVLKLIRKIKPKKSILTNLSNEIDYNEIKKKLPNNIIPAYDGLTVLI